MMACIRGRDTAPELLVRQYLHAAGLRFRLHAPGLSGRPDIVLARYRVAVFVHGCFWHRHPDCRYATTPSSRTDFWQEKFRGTVERDGRNVAALVASGWNVLVVWECETRDELMLDQLFWRIVSLEPVRPSRPGAARRTAKPPSEPTGVSPGRPGNRLSVA